MKVIDTLEKWNILAYAMKEKGYRLWQMQYSWDSPEGFHAWFSHPIKQNVEVVTKNIEVEKAIVKYNAT